MLNIMVVIIHYEFVFNKIILHIDVHTHMLIKTFFSDITVA